MSLTVFGKYGSGHEDYLEVELVLLGQTPSMRSRIGVTLRLYHLPSGTTTDTLVIGTGLPYAREFKVPMNILVED